jgi:hypothetical protein
MLFEAVKRGYTKVRKANWAFASDHLELYVQNGFYGPWGTLHSPETAIALKDETYRAQIVFVLGDSADDWEPFEGG